MTLFPSMPPLGRGLYARDTVEPGAWDVVAIDHRRSDRRAQAADARRRGADVFVYSTPEAWRPGEWAATLPRIVAVARELGASGIIADPEGGWEGRADRERGAAELGRALANVSGVSVGVTSFPSWPGLEGLASEAGGAIWVSPQLYGVTRAPTAALYESWFRPWADRFGGRAIPSIAGWYARESYRTPSGFAAYLATLPRVGGFLAWDAAGTMPRALREALLAWDPGSTIVARARTVPPFVVVAILVIVAALAALKVRV